MSVDWAVCSQSWPLSRELSHYDWAQQTHLAGASFLDRLNLRNIVPRIHLFADASLVMIGNTWVLT